MKNEFRLALFAHIFDLQLKLAKAVVDAQFREPLKEFLLNLPAKDRRDGFEVGKLVKAYIQEDRASEQLDAQRVQEDFAAAVASGKIGYADLKDMASKGFIGTTNFAEVARELVDRKVAAGYTVKVPGGGRPALKILALDKGELEGVASAMKDDLDIAALIKNAAGAKALQAVEKQLKGGQVAIQRP